ncbi:bifunctional glucose-1-phosphatase/inositol phosphatase [Serratia fonticola]|uniref:bifunctional glucose-1-phosphatase/inositol phosphatase n=1 Tax=Serratia fonticola TaxID=47917 RepID=UPI0015C63768|nr:bifunctional glucose-1-phosphatase/inositol phosphatase [Serratia fonticola]MBC3379042.1 bifunctional glucose-1-phosphatase/inositol phosphatase [Serratia fonticola]NYA38242.1 bifunctional glucose-1-phosphatase/inositol phosphatase [Serratia fonticola]
MNFLKKSLLLPCAALLMMDIASAAEVDYELKQVLIVSRHGLRAPLVDGATMIIEATPNQWPQWNTKGGLLTTKGGALEVFMGSYFSDWLNQEKILSKDMCPTEDELYVYANVMSRTLATGQFFSTGAYPGCDIKIHHQSDMAAKDPLFYQSIKDDSKTFNKEATQQINAFLSSQEFKKSYETLEKVIDYHNSKDCKVNKLCDLSKQENSVELVYGKEPAMPGGLYKSFLMIDAFMLQDYEGYPKQQVAWGNIKSEEDWKSLAKLRNTYIEATYLQPMVVQNIIRPMLKNISGILKENKVKVSVLVGHDTTAGPILAAMGFNEYQLPGQYEKNPISGKIVFQRWLDKKKNQDLLKVEYVYQSTQQMRDLELLTLDNPPQRVTLTLKGCEADKNGFCLWRQFEDMMGNLIN